MPDQLASPPNPALARLVVSVAGLPAALAFYQQLLGLTLTRQAPGFAWLKTTDRVEILLHERDSQSSDTAVSISFLVDNLDAVVSKWEQQGEIIIDPPASQPWGERMAVVRDPDGHIVCLSERT